MTDYARIDFDAIKTYDGWLQLYRPSHVVWFRGLSVWDQMRLAEPHALSREQQADYGGWLEEMDMTAADVRDTQ